MGTSLLSPLYILLGFFLYSLGHSVMASHRFKDLSAALFGDLHERYYRLIYNAGAVLSFLPILALVALLPDRHLYTIRLPYAVLWMAVQGVAVLVLVLSLSQTGALEFMGFTQVFAPQKSEQAKLVRRGFYRYIRHPLYTAGMLFIWFTPYLTLNLLALNTGITLYFAIGTIFEERKMIKAYGQAYLDYQQHTPRFLPRLKDLFGVQ